MPRILLGLWHPSFLKAAMEHVPYLKRSHIGMSPYIAREYFWDGVDAFSMNFGSLCTQEGERSVNSGCLCGNAVVILMSF